MTPVCGFETTIFFVFTGRRKNFIPVDSDYKDRFFLNADSKPNLAEISNIASIPVLHTITPL
jgi:hypothetical protein